MTLTHYVFNIEHSINNRSNTGPFYRNRATYTQVATRRDKQIGDPDSQKLFTSVRKL